MGKTMLGSFLHPKMNFELALWEISFHAVLCNARAFHAQINRDRPSSVMISVRICRVERGVLTITHHKKGRVAS